MVRSIPLTAPSTISLTQPVVGILVLLSFEFGVVVVGTPENAGLLIGA